MKDIKQRIDATRKTSQITNAMNMVSASKMKRAERLINEFSHYTYRIEEIVSNLVSSKDSDINHPLLKERDVKKIAYVLVSSDRGLAGAYNSSVLKTFAADAKNEGVDYTVFAIGKKASTYVKNHKLSSINVQPELNKDKVTFLHVKLIAKQLLDRYLDGEFDEVRIYYNHFINTLTQEVTVKRLLPVEVNESRTPKSYEFEPSPEEVLSALLPVYIENTIYGILLDSKASEHAARMTAMQSATDNATDIIASLQLYYNRARQAAITLELTDIIGGANAVE